jgi:hypothetical protein
MRTNIFKSSGCGHGNAAAACVAGTLLWACGPVFADLGKTVINVQDFGAKGNGITNDGPAIQLALNAAKVLAERAEGTCKPRGAQVFFPEGIYLVTDTLRLNNCVNVEIVGSGLPAVDPRTNLAQFPHCGGDGNNPRVYINGPQTTIIADFATVPTPRPLFEFDGSVARSVRDLAIYGCPTPGSPSRVNCSALIQTESHGWGSTNAEFRNLSLGDAVLGILLGDPAGADSNNEVFTFERVYGYNVDTVFRTATPQALNLVFQQVGGTQCKTVFDFDYDIGGTVGNDSGGNISVDTVSLTACGGPGADDWVIKVYGQVNTGVYRFNNIRPETTTQKLLRSRGSGMTVLSNIQDSRQYNATPPPLVLLQGGGVLIDGSDCMPNTSAGSFGKAYLVDFDPLGGAKCTFRVRDSLLPTTRPANGVTKLADLIKDLDGGAMPVGCFYLIDGCDGSGQTPLTNAKSASAW